MNEGLPISDERLEELAEGLSEEARAVLDRWLANLELPVEIRLSPDEIVSGAEALSQGERDRLMSIADEVRKGFECRIRENEAVIEMGERALEIHERAAALDDSIGEHSPLVDAIEVLKALGEPVPVSDEELNIEIEVRQPVEEADWVSIPASEIPTDVNGIPTKEAAKDGFGMPDGEGGTIKLYPLQVDAMRVLSCKHTFKKFVEEEAEVLAEYKQMYREEIEAAGMVETLGEEGVKEMISELLSRDARNLYLLGLATWVKNAPGPRGLIDHYKGRDTRAARRYKKWHEETEKEAVKEIVKEIVGEAIDEAVEAGAIEKIITEDGREYLKQGTNYEAWRREIKEEENT